METPPDGLYHVQDRIRRRIGGGQSTGELHSIIAVEFLDEAAQRARQEARVTVHEDQDVTLIPGQNPIQGRRFPPSLRFLDQDNSSVGLRPLHYNPIRSVRATARDDENFHDRKSGRERLGQH